MPLILFPIILLYVIFVIWGTINIVSKQKTIKRKWLFSILIPFVFFLGPFGDEFVARPYFYYLCNTEGGVKVFKTVYLDERHFDKHGELVFLEDAKNPSTFELLNRYKGNSGKYKKYDSPFNIRIGVKHIKDNKTGEVISEHRTFLYDYGLVANKLMEAMPGQSISCHHYWKEKEYIEFFDKTFKKIKHI